jgi:diketogulonate reductase-like aldo/keto reductase
MLEGLRKLDRPTPAVNQVELHPYMRRDELVAYCREHGILLMAFSPLTRGQKLGEPEVVSIAEKYVFCSLFWKKMIFDLYVVCLFIL